MTHLDFDKARMILVQALNMSLDIGNETTFSNSFDIAVAKDGFRFVPRVPAGYILDSALYQRIFQIASGTLYPFYTLLKQNGAYFVPLLQNNVHTARALFFPWLVGIPTRLEIDDFANFKEEWSLNEIPLMQNLSLNIYDITHLVIAGNSGAGKTYALIYLLEMLRGKAELHLVDPKVDTPTRWGNKYGIDILTPVSDRSQNDFVNSVCELLSDALNVIRERQDELRAEPSHRFQPYVIVIDELLALSSSATRSIKETFFGLLSQVALLGRATSVKMILLSQRFDNTALPIVVREQANVMIQLGNVNRKTTQFLLPDLENLDGIVIPSGKGTGLIQIIDGKHPANVMPLLMPTYKEK